MTKKWYVIQTYSGMEEKAKRNIEHKIAVEGLKEYVGQLIIPSESVVEIKNGKKRNVLRPVMPGYLFIEMELNNEVFALVGKITGVSGFVGDGRNPTQLNDSEVKKILHLVSEKSEKVKPEIKYHIGEQVRVAKGPFTNFIGVIEQIDADKGKLRVSVSIFGRSTPVELDAMQVESV